MSTVHTKTKGNIDRDLIETLSGPELVAVATELSGKPYKRFSSRTVGIERVRLLFDEAVEAKKTNDEDPPRKKKFSGEPRLPIMPYRQGTKRAALIELLLKGATFVECQAALGGATYKQTYANIFMLHKYFGFGIRESDDGVIQIYV